MNRIAAIALALAISVSPKTTDGHGTPIQVGATSALSASGGLADANGYAPMLFYESSESGDPFATLTLPSVGPVIIWQIPGFSIAGLNPTSSVSIEVLPRPVNNATPVEQRALWYWNPATSQVAPTASPLYLLGTSQRFATIDPAIATPLAPFLLADPIGGTQAEGGQQGFHNHGLLSYALDNSPTAPPGAYGLFARLISNQYAPSNPFLIVLNRSVDYEQMAEAALAINAAAFLPGDYNHDDRVDAADYVVWRRSLNSTIHLAADGSGDGIVDQADFNVWRSNFGQTFPAADASGVNSNAMVPEPAAILIAIISAIVAACQTERARLFRPAVSTG